jgi:hypothetical protein
MLFQPLPHLGQARCNHIERLAEPDDLGCGFLFDLVALNRIAVTASWLRRITEPLDDVSCVTHFPTSLTGTPAAAYLSIRNTNPQTIPIRNSHTTQQFGQPGGCFDWQNTGALSSQNPLIYLPPSPPRPPRRGHR